MHRYCTWELFAICLLFFLVVSSKLQWSIQRELWPIGFIRYPSSLTMIRTGFESWIEDANTTKEQSLSHAILTLSPVLMSPKYNDNNNNKMSPNDVWDPLSRRYTYSMQDVIWTRLLLIRSIVQWRQLKELAKHWDISLVVPVKWRPSHWTLYYENIRISFSLANGT